MYCTITAGLLLSNVSVASLPCSNFDEVAIVEEQNKIATVAEAKVQVASIDHSYVPLPPSQPKRSEIKISTTTINLEPSNIKNMSLLVVHTPENVLKTSVAGARWRAGIHLLGIITIPAALFVLSAGGPAAVLSYLTRRLAQ